MEKVRSFLSERRDSSGLTTICLSYVLRRHVIAVDYVTQKQSFSVTELELETELYSQLMCMFDTLN